MKIYNCFFSTAHERDEQDPDDDENNDENDDDDDDNDDDEIVPSILSSSTANISLDVAFGPTSGKVSVEGAFNASVGATLTLDCDAGNVAPEVEVVWTKNGDAIEMKQVRVKGKELEVRRKR